MLFPGVAFCIGGVFAISHKRDERIAKRLLEQQGVDHGASLLYDPPSGLGPIPDGQVDAASMRGALDAFVADTGGGGSGGGGPGSLTGGGHTQGTATMGTLASMPTTRGLSAVDLLSQGAGRRSGLMDPSRVSEACSVCSMASVQSHVSLEESSFVGLGGGAFTSIGGALRMARQPASQSAPPSPPRTPEGLNSGVLSQPGSYNDRLGATPPSLMPHARDVPGSVREALLPRCSEGASSVSTEPALDRATR